MKVSISLTLLIRLITFLAKQGGYDDDFPPDDPRNQASKLHDELFNEVNKSTDPLANLLTVGNNVGNSRMQD